MNEFRSTKFLEFTYKYEINENKAIIILLSLKITGVVSSHRRCQSFRTMDFCCRIVVKGGLLWEVVYYSNPEHWKKEKKPNRKFKQLLTPDLSSTSLQYHEPGVSSGLAEPRTWGVPGTFNSIVCALLKMMCLFEKGKCRIVSFFIFEEIFFCLLATNLKESNESYILYPKNMLLIQ